VYEKRRRKIKKERPQLPTGGERGRLVQMKWETKDHLPHKLHHSSLVVPTALWNSRGRALASDIIYI